MTTVMRVRTETRAKRRRAPSVVPLVVGVVIERTVVRFLYGRPLETLLATYGLSLLLIQATRTLFGAQNVEVANPSWMSGAIQLLPNLILPWNRIYIIAFALAVVAETDLIAALPRRFAARHAAQFGVSVVDAPLPMTTFRLNAIVPAVARMDAGLAWLFDTLTSALPEAVAPPSLA